MLKTFAGDLNILAHQDNSWFVPKMPKHVYSMSHKATSSIHQKLTRKEVDTSCQLATSQDTPDLSMVGC